MPEIFGNEIKPIWLVIGCLASILVGLAVCHFLKDNYVDGTKWSCSETGCELTLGGEYDTEEECKNSGCKLKDLKKVTFNDKLHTYYYKY